jgi:hypothetical protein
MYLLSHLYNQIKSNKIIKSIYDFNYSFLSSHIYRDYFPHFYYLEI